jgi:hypothetical protein
LRQQRDWHGYLTLALLPKLTSTICRAEGFAAAINYGLNRVARDSQAPAGAFPGWSRTPDAPRKGGKTGERVGKPP